MKVIIILLLVLLASSAEATIRYADPAGSGSTCSSGSPCTLSQAMTDSVAGDTIKLKAGTYPTPSNINVTGSAGNLITIEPDTGANVIIEGGWCDCQSTYVHFRAPAGTTFVIDGRDGVADECSIGLAFIEFSIVEGLEIHHAGNQGIFGVRESQLLNLNIHDIGGTECVGESLPEQQHGIYTGGGQYINNIIDGATIDNVSGKGIQCYSACSGTTIKNTITSNTDRDGIYILGGSGNRLYNSVATRNNGSSGAGIYAYNTEIYNVTVYDNVGVGLMVEGGSTIVRNSISLDSDGGNYSIVAGTPTESNNIFAYEVGETAADYFTNPATYDLTLVAASPAIDTGTSIAAIFTTDILGTGRPQGSTWDVGAYEYDPSPPPETTGTTSFGGKLAIGGKAAAQ